MVVVDAGLATQGIRWILLLVIAARGMEREGEE
jgi:hypothetical protein